MEMDFVVDYASLANLSMRLINNYNGWMDQLTSLEKEVTQFIGNKLLQGEGAQQIKEYMKDNHLYIIGTLRLICYLHENNYATYYRDYGNIEFDAARGKILSAELHEIKNKLISTRANMDNIDKDISSTLRGIADIFTASCNVENVLKIHGQMVGRIDALEKKIRDTESVHKSKDFTETGNLISDLERFIKDLIDKTRVYKSTYVSGAISEMTSWTSLNVSAVAAADYAEKKESDYTEAIQIQNEAVNEYLNYEEQLRREREKTASYIKGAVWFAGVVASVAVIVSTGGMAAPAVMGTVSAVKVAVNTITDELTDAYVEDGDLGNVKWGDLGKDVLVSATISYVGGKASTYITGMVGEGLQCSIISEVVKGGIDRGITSGVNEMVEMGVSIKNGEINNIGDFGEALEESVKDIRGDVFNLKEIGKDFAAGFIVLDGTLWEGQTAL